MILHIAQLSTRTTSVSLHQLFGNYGKVRQVKIVKDPETDLSKGYGYIEMFDFREAITAIKSLNNYVLDGMAIKVNFAK